MDLQNFVTTINAMSKHVHQVNIDAGWWTDLTREKKVDALLRMGIPAMSIEAVFSAMGVPLYGKKERNMGELLMLKVSEIAEAMEGHRKNLMDDKLPHRKMIEVEMADLIIRVFDTAGANDWDLGNTILEKMEYNRTRQDHKLENRMKEGGKAY